MNNYQDLYEDLRADVLNTLSIKQRYSKSGYVYFGKRRPTGGGLQHIKIGISFTPYMRMGAQNLAPVAVVQVDNMAEAETFLHVWLRRHAVDGYGFEEFLLTDSQINAAITMCGRLSIDAAIRGGA